MAISRSSIGKSVSKGSKPKGGLTKWFKEDWVDIGSKKKGGGYAKCGRSKQKADAKRKYPKCVPAAKAASMSKSQIKSVQIYNKEMINLKEQEGILIHQNLPDGYSTLSEDKIIEIQNSLSDLQHNGFILRSDLPSSPNFKARYELKNGTILFINFYDISGEGIYVTFDWNYLNEEIQISKFIDPLLDGSQFQLSTVSLLTKFAYKVPQLFFDNNNLKLRAKSE